MAAGKFRLNKGTIAKILKTHDGGKREVAQRILAQMNDPEARIDIYTTDREVVGIVIPADTEAKHGTATRAVNKVRNM
ncbi:MAG TPA: hypothetical protein VMV33_03845 [Rhodocyclaceae bacterium]|nr:hypothetical protein [Rhodocyclaceae bacterium]